jgi:putative tryptophan/tyrosine transport system substrate-binding protein
MQVIGYLTVGTEASEEPYTTELRKGLDEGGFVEGRNVEILFRYAERRFDRLPSLTSDLVDRRVAVIVAGGSAPALAAKATTTTIPIVFQSIYDPVALGLVANLSRPGGNITGATGLASAFFAKGIELMHELLPQASVLALLLNPTSPTSFVETKEAETAGQALGLRLINLKASNPGEINQAFAVLAQERPSGLIVNPDRLYTSQRDQLVALAARYRIPVIYPDRESVRAGGLMSYGGSIADAHRIAGNYAARILKGASPADLPVQQSSKVELILNLKTATALGLTVPLTLLGRADEIIE